MQGYIINLYFTGTTFLRDNDTAPDKEIEAFFAKLLAWAEKSSSSSAPIPEYTYSNNMGSSANSNEFVGRCPKCQTAIGNGLAYCVKCGTEMPQEVITKSSKTDTGDPFEVDPDFTVSFGTGPLWLSLIFLLALLPILCFVPKIVAQFDGDTWTDDGAIVVIIVLFSFGVWLPTPRVRIEIDSARKSARITRLRWPLRSQVTRVSLADARGALINSELGSESVDYDLVLRKNGNKKESIRYTTCMSMNRAIRMANALDEIIKELHPLP